MKIRTLFLVAGIASLLSSAALGSDSALSGQEKRRAVSLAKVGHGPGEKISFASAFQTIPLVANYEQNGIWTKTYLSVTNPTSKEITVYATLFTIAGQFGQLKFQIPPRQTYSWSDFIGDQGFHFLGRGALELDSWFGPPDGSSDDDFIIQIGLHRVVPGIGRLFTVLDAGSSLDSIGGTYDGYNSGIPNNTSRKTSIGVFNDSFSSSSITVRLIDSAGGLVETENLNVPGNSWFEKPLSKDLSVGCLRWSSDSTVYAYALTEDQHTGDISFQPAVSYIP